jgi:hypothetical protein
MIIYIYIQLESHSYTCPPPSDLSWKSAQGSNLQKGIALPRHKTTPAGNLPWENQEVGEN